MNEKNDIGRRASTDLQDFVFDGRLPSRIQDTFNNGMLTLKDGTVISIPSLTSYVTGVMLGCTHEFRVGSHDTYSVHLNTLKDRPSIFHFIKDNFGIARPTDPLVAMGKFTKLVDLEQVLKLATPDHKSRVIVCQFWKVVSGDDDRSEIKDFYFDWISNVRQNLKDRDLYDHAFFLAGFVHSLPSATDLTTLKFDAVIKSYWMAHSMPSRHGRAVVYPDKTTELFDIRPVNNGTVSVLAAKDSSAVKFALVNNDAVYIIPTGELRKIIRPLTVDCGALPIQEIEQAEHHGRAEEYIIPKCLL